MTQRAELRTIEPLTDLTDHPVMGVTRARVRAPTAITISSVRSVRAAGSPAGKGEKLLRAAAAVLAQRRRHYGAASVLFDRAARRWSITLGRRVTAAQVVMCLIDLKLARLVHDPKHQDSVVDVAGYAAVLRAVVP